MHYVELDVTNLKLWLAGTHRRHRQPDVAATTATSCTSRIGAPTGTRERTKPASTATRMSSIPGPRPAAPNGGLLEPGRGRVQHDRRKSGQRCWIVYGGMPNFQGVYNTVRAGSLAPLDVNARPPTTARGRPGAGQSRRLLFRRALKLRARRHHRRSQQPAGDRPHRRRREPGLRAGQLQRDGDRTSPAPACRRRSSATRSRFSRTPGPIRTRSWRPNDPTATAPASTPATVSPRSPARAGRSTGRRWATSATPFVGRSSAPTAASATSCATRGLERRRPHDSLQGFDRQPVLQPAGDRHVQVLHERVRLGRAQLQLRSRTS